MGDKIIVARRFFGKEGSSVTYIEVFEVFFFLSNHLSSLVRPAVRKLVLDILGLLIDWFARIRVVQSGVYLSARLDLILHDGIC